MSSFYFDVNDEQIPYLRCNLKLSFKKGVIKMKEFYEVIVKSINPRAQKVKFYQSASEALTQVNFKGFHLTESDIGTADTGFSIDYDENGRPNVQIACYAEEEGTCATKCVGYGEIITINAVYGDFEEIDEAYGIRNLEDQFSFGKLPYEGYTYKECQELREETGVA